MPSTLRVVCVMKQTIPVAVDLKIEALRRHSNWCRRWCSRLGLVFLVGVLAVAWVSRYRPPGIEYYGAVLACGTIFALGGSLLFAVNWRLTRQEIALLLHASEAPDADSSGEVVS